MADTDFGKIQEEIGKLKNQLSNLQSELDYEKGYVVYKGEKKVKLVLLLIPLILFTLLPSLLFTLDRWWGVEGFRNYSRESICKIDFLCRTALPGYIFWVVFSFIIIAIIILNYSSSFQGEIKDRFLPEPDLHIEKRNGLTNRRKKLLVLAVEGLVLEIIYCLISDSLPGLELFLIAGVYLFFLLPENLNLEQWLLASWSQLKNKWALYGTFLFTQLALILFIRAMQSTDRFIPFVNYILLGMAIFLIIIKFKELGKIYWIITLGLMLMTYQMNSWHFSKIGDEYSFFYYPFNIISNQNIFQISANFFRIDAVYGNFSYFSALIQYIGMAIFGKNHFGWHISGILVVLLSLPLLYDFFKTFLNERLAFIAVLLLSCSTYLISFSKVGYSNLQSLFIGSLVLWATGRTIKNKSLPWFFALGVLMGLCFYSFPAALFFLPLPLLMLLIYHPPQTKSDWWMYSQTILGLFLVFIPILFQPAYYDNMLLGTFVGSKVWVYLGASLPEHFASNLIYSLIGHLVSFRESHYVVSSYLDPLSGAFVVPGILLAIANLRTNRFMKFLVISFFFVLITMGTIHQFDLPPLTRMFQVLPFYVIFAAIGLDWMIRLFASCTNRPGKIFSYGLSIALVGIFLLNIVQSTQIFEKRYLIYDSEPTILHLLQVDAPHVAARPNDFKNYLILSQGNFDLGWLYTFQDIYELPDSRTQYLQLQIDSPQIPPIWLERIRDEENLIVLIPPVLSDDLRLALQPILAQQGRNPCDIRNNPGEFIEIQAWFSPKYEGLCKEVQNYSWIR